MADLDPLATEDAPESQAVKARFNPWWLLGVALLVVAVVLGVRKVRKRQEPLDPLAFEPLEPPAP